MADNFETTTITPDLPAEAVTPGHLSLLRACGFDVEESSPGMLYAFSENGTHMLNDGETDLDALVIHGLSDALKERLDDDPDSIEFTTILQDVLRESPKGSIKGDEIIARTGFSCSKARPDEFGGVLTRITRNSIVSFGTYDDDLARCIEKSVESLDEVLAAATANGSASRAAIKTVRALQKKLDTLCSTHFDDQPSPPKRSAGPRM